MKKSMLISTVLMVVLLVVAISTATFAWYTSNTQVNVTNTAISSAASTSASLSIDTTANTNSTNSSITITMGADLQPMIPDAEPSATDTITTYDTFIGSFTTANVNNAGIFTNNGSGTTPAEITNVKAGVAEAVSQDSFFVINTNKENATDVNAKVNIATEGYMKLAAQPIDWSTNYTDYYTVVDGEYVAVTGETAPTFGDGTYYTANANIANHLRVAMFVDGNYVGTWATTAADTRYGTISNGADSSALATYAASANNTAIGIGNFAALGNKEIQLVAWFDGNALTVADAGAIAVFSVTFEAVG